MVQLQRRAKIPPPSKRQRRQPDLPENANQDLFTFHNEENSDFNPLTFNKPVPSYLCNNFNSEASLHRDGKIQLNNSLIALTLSEGDSANHDKFFVTNYNKELSDFFKLVYSPKLNFWPSGRSFGDSHKKRFHFDIENIKMAISSFQGHAALAQLAYPTKINDIDFITKVVICPLKKHMDLIKSLIRSFRSRALPKSLNDETRDYIIKADIDDIWVLSDDQKLAIASCFCGGPLPRGGVASSRGGRFNFGYRYQNNSRGKFNYFRGFRGNFGYRSNFRPYRRGNMRGGRRGGRGQGGQSAGNSEVKERKEK